MGLAEPYGATEKLDEICHALAALMKEVDSARRYSLAREVSAGLDNKAVSELRRLFVSRKRWVLGCESQHPHSALEFDVSLKRLREDP
jgi:hypothetical protein